MMFMCDVLFIKGLYFNVFILSENFPLLIVKFPIYSACIHHKSTAGRYRSDSYPDGPMTARYRFM